MYRRYAVYFTPPGSAFADFGAAWLGWDMARGAAVPHPDIEGLPAPLADITVTPRKYGLHATLKPPFRLAGGTDAEALEQRFAAFCATHAPVSLEAGLTLARLGRFLALVPGEASGPLMDLAGDSVRAFDDFRAPPGAAELDRRRAAGLSETQEANLVRWGYPYVMDAFRFHITLTGRLPKARLQAVEEALAPRLAPIMPRPFIIDALSLAGEDAHGMFHLVHRCPLSG